MRSILGVAPVSNFVKEVEYQIAMLAFKMDLGSRG
jgi:hypothetical protein